MSDFRAQLRDAGMSVEESAAKVDLFARLSSELRRLTPSAVTIARMGAACFVPGRLELFGKHTDYAGGRSIIGAIERGICLVASRRMDAQIRIVDAARGSSVEFSLNASIEPRRGQLSNFPMTVARRLARDFPEMRTGADILFASDLPRASGMSSSSAMVIAFLFVLARANSLENTERWRQFLQTREHLASYAASIESGAGFRSFSEDAGVGTHGGSEDHIGILCSRAGFLQQYSFCPARLEKEICFPEDWSLVVAVSGVKADKTGDALESYNRASRAVQTVLKLWQSAKGSGVAASLAPLLAKPEVREELQQMLRASNISQYSSECLLRRMDQLHEESNEIVPAAAEALAGSDMELLGALADRSQFLAETCLENQMPETISLARSARQLGAAAASAFGAGFGGSVWAAIETRRAEEFCNRWAAQYHQRFPARADASRFFAVRPGPPLIEFQ